MTKDRNYLITRILAIGANNARTQNLSAYVWARRGRQAQV